VPWTLAGYAHYEASTHLLLAGQLDAAMAEAKRIPADLVVASAVDRILADALLGKKEFDDAARHYRTYLAREKHPPGWVTVALRFAGALLQHPSEAHAEEAIRLARRVELEATGGQGAETAKDLVDQALATLPAKRRKGMLRLSPEEQLEKARSFIAARRPRDAVLLTDRLIGLSWAKKPSELSCGVWLVRAEGLTKMHKKKLEAAEAYGGAIPHCVGTAFHVTALYSAAKASASAGRNQEAMDRFLAVERDFPKHRLAEAARLRGARAALDANDEPRFVAMLESIAADYPEGDAATEGLFQLALHSMDKHDWARAALHLQRAMAREPHERAYFAAGRLPYFLARVHIEGGDIAKALGELAVVIRDYPLSYYMTLAYARLAERDPAAAERAVAEALAAEPDGPFLLAAGPYLEAPSFLRARELARQGDVEPMRVELDALGLGARSAPREVLYAAAFLFAKAGSSAQSHQILRSGLASAHPTGIEVVDWHDHYPKGKYRAVWELAYPRPYESLVAPAAAREQVPEAWVHAIMREESAFEPHAVSPAKAYGLMQLIVPTADRMGRALDLHVDEGSLKRPEVNIALGCRVLMDLRRKFPDNVLLAVPGYNAGDIRPREWVQKEPTALFDRWVEAIPFEETRNYTKRVVGSIAAYEFLYARDKPSEALRSPPAASPEAARAAMATKAP